MCVGVRLDSVRARAWRPARAPRSEARPRAPAGGRGEQPASSSGKAHAAPRMPRCIPAHDVLGP